MDKNYFEFAGANDQEVKAVENQFVSDELSDLQLVLVGGGIGDTII